MLAFAHIPTGTTTNNGFDIDEVNGRFVESVAPVTAIGADIRDRQGYTLRSGSGCLTIRVHLIHHRLETLLDQRFPFFESAGRAAYVNHNQPRGIAR